MLEGKITGLETLGIAFVISVVISAVFIVGTRISKGRWIFEKNERKTLPAKKCLNQYGK